MSQLTEEQRRRIEENRRKALEKRAALSSNGNNHVGLPTGTKNAAAIQPSKTFVGNSAAITPSLTKNNVDLPSFKTSSVVQSYNPFLKSDKFFAINPKNNISVTYNKAQSIPIVPSAHDSKQFNNSFKRTETVKGTCVLHSRQRFYVNMGYHKEMIDVFKTIPSRLYDMQTKKWNFLIQDHEKLITAAKSLQPDVLLVPLPPLIIKIFSSASGNKIIKEHNLSVLDPVIFNALLPFQRDGVNFAIQHGGRVLIADDMGLGKTIQAIAITNYYSKDWPLLVVTPSSVRYAWEEAFHRWLPSLEAEEVSVINSGKDHIPNNKVILMSYDLLTKMKDTIINRKFRTIIWDESHFLKNHKSARTKAATEVMKNVTRIIMLTGTPALSRPMELYTQISALRPQDFLGFKEYGMRYCNGKMTKWGWDFSGSSHMEELQILLEETVMIRRLKSDVMQQLPTKIRQMVILDPSLVSTKNKVLRAMYRKMQEENLKGMERRGALLEYFHQTGEVKLKAVCEYVFDLLESDKKFLCFAHHQNVLNGICNAIETKKVDYIRIDGSVSSEARKKLCDKFQLNDSCRVAVLSITSANCGITLTAASLVVFAELFWNPGILTQAEDRAHRIGQEDSVVVQYLVAKGTADDEMWPLVQRKLDILNKAGLSKDNFRSADTVIREDKAQSHLQDFWEEFSESDISASNDTIDTCYTPVKRLKLDL